MKGNNMDFLQALTLGKELLGAIASLKTANEKLACSCDELKQSNESLKSELSAIRAEIEAIKKGE